MQLLVASIGLMGIKNQKLWGFIKSLEALQPNANAKNNYFGQRKKLHGFSLFAIERDKGEESEEKSIDSKPMDD
ncbi:hypothetical protein VNO77_03972 [Canavalia gladiata]|uniref:Uncharacterized protein n=1 Tax=Canavalia gladiata TaxID=3824 RepID=A0AAN9N257_CANGL